MTLVFVFFHCDGERGFKNGQTFEFRVVLRKLYLVHILDKLNCSQDYTLLFVAFDLEETQPACPLQGNCSCSGGLCGSGHFVQNFSTYLNSSGEGFQGALILETILNHNTTPNSQDIPQSLQTVLPTVYNKVAKNNFKGDFLAVIGRLANDEGLTKGITNAFKQDGKYCIAPEMIPGLSTLTLKRSLMAVKPWDCGVIKIQEIENFSSICSLEIMCSLCQH